MRISDKEVQKILSGEYTTALVESPNQETLDHDDQELVREVTAEVGRMPDREDVIADLRARIQAGTYNPTGEEIADTMIRRAIADRVR